MSIGKNINIKNFNNCEQLLDTIHMIKENLISDVIRYDRSQFTTS